MSVLIPNGTTSFNLVVTWGNAPALSLQFFLSRTEVVGHGSVMMWVDAPDGELDALRDLDFEWDTGDYYAFTSHNVFLSLYGEGLHAEALRAIKGGQAGRYRGHVACHAFSTDGAHEITCTVRNRAGVLMAEAVGTVTRISPDAAYPGTDTICYSRDGDFTGAPAGASLITVSDGVVSRGTGASDNKRIMLRAGQDFSGNIELARAQYAYLTTFGEGAPAIWDSTINAGGNSGISSEGWTIDNIVIPGPYDPTDETQTDWWLQDPVPAEPPGWGVRNLDVASGVHATLFRVHSFGRKICFDLRGFENAIDCAAWDFFDYGIFSLRNGNVGFTSVQNPGAQKVNMEAAVASNRSSWNTLGIVSGDPKPNHPRHGPLRFNAEDRPAVVSLGIFANTTAGHSNTLAQPAGRIFRNGNPECLGNASDNFFLGSVGEMADKEKCRTLVFDGNIIRVTPMQTQALAAPSANTRVRNNLIFGPTSHEDAVPNFTFVSDDGTATTLSGEPAVLDGNTFVVGDLAGKSVRFMSGGMGGPPVWRNNLIVDGSTDGTINAPSEGMEISGAPGFDAELRPLTSNTAVVGQATDPVPVRDLDGVLRPASASIGALEPADD
jgi:hypothetical protein